MAIHLPSGDENDDSGILSDINVTPFIDVMLVLLIVFMIAAPLATVDIKVNLPSVNAAPAPARDRPPLTLTIKADGGLMLQEKPLSLEELPARLEAASEGDKEQRLFIHADENLPYGQLMTVVQGVRGAGFLKVAFVGQERAP